MFLSCPAFLSPDGARVRSGGADEAGRGLRLFWCWCTLIQTQTQTGLVLVRTTSGLTWTGLKFGLRSRFDDPDTDNFDWADTVRFHFDPNTKAASLLTLPLLLLASRSGRPPPRPPWPKAPRRRPRAKSRRIRRREAATRPSSSRSGLRRSGRGRRCSTASWRRSPPNLSSPSATAPSLETRPPPSPAPSRRRPLRPPPRRQSAAEPTTTGSRSSTCTPRKSAGEWSSLPRRGPWPPLPPPTAKRPL